MGKNKKMINVCKKEKDNHQEVRCAKIKNTKKVVVSASTLLIITMLVILGRCCHLSKESAELANNSDVKTTLSVTPNKTTNTNSIDINQSTKNNTTKTSTIDFGMNYNNHVTTGAVAYKYMIEKENNASCYYGGVAVSKSETKTNVATNIGAEWQHTTDNGVSYTFGAEGALAIDNNKNVYTSISGKAEVNNIPITENSTLGIGGKLTVKNYYGETTPSFSIYGRYLIGNTNNASSLSNNNTTISLMNFSNDVNKSTNKNSNKENTDDNKKQEDTTKKDLGNDQTQPIEPTF